MRTMDRSAACSLALIAALTAALCLPCCSQVTAPSQVVSQTGLLPVYGVDLAIDPSWADGAAFPSQSAEFPNQGMSAAFQQVWDTLKPTGFNCLRFRVDVADAKAWANRTANLCLWASANGIKLVPVLTGPADASFTKCAWDFVTALAGAMKAQNLPAYSQILGFQVQDKMNHAGLHGGMTPDAAAKMLVSGATAVRSAEQAALAGTGVYSTPIMVNISFDYETVKAKAMAGVVLSDAAFTEACESARQFVKQLTAAPEIDIYNLEWFPGSVGAGTVDKLPDLLKNLKGDLAGKQVAFTTGFSAGFNPATDQKTYYAAAFTNLVGYRAQESADGLFLGVFFHEAVDSLQPDPTPPRRTCQPRWPRGTGRQKRPSWLPCGRGARSRLSLSGGWARRRTTWECCRSRRTPQPHLPSSPDSRRFLA